MPGAALGGKFLAEERGAFDGEPEDPAAESDEAPPRFPLIDIARMDPATRSVLREVYHQAC